MVYSEYVYGLLGALLKCHLNYCLQQTRRNTLPAGAYTRTQQAQSAIHTVPLL